MFAAGNEKKISWIVENDKCINQEIRNHVDIYLDKVTPAQSQYIALHVGIFWSIGRFIINNEDTINVKLDSEEMYYHLKEGADSPDRFIHERTWFLKELIKQRKLKVNYQLIERDENRANKLL